MSAKDDAASAATAAPKDGAAAEGEAMPDHPHVRIVKRKRAGGAAANNTAAAAGNDAPHTDEAAPHADDARSTDHEKERMKRYSHHKSHPVIGLLIFCALQCISLLFVVVATPIEMYTLRDTWRDNLYPALAGSSRPICVTAWGMKHGCRSIGYYNRDYTHTFCYRVRVNFRVVEAFCIMTIAFMTVALVLGILSSIQHVSKGAVAAVAGTAMVFSIIPWGIIAGMYHQLPCCETAYFNAIAVSRSCVGQNPNVRGNMPRFKDMGRYGAGFGLLVTAWVLQLIGTVFAIVPL